MAWDSLDDLWWLKPGEKHVQAINGLALGAQLRQQGFENKMAVKKMVMDESVQQLRNKFAEQHANQNLIEFFRDTDSIQKVDDYVRRLNGTATDSEPPLPPGGLTPRFALQAHNALSDWKSQTAVTERIKTATETMEAVAKFQNGLLNDARALIMQGGANVIQMGPKGPMVDPSDLATAAEALRIKQAGAAVPSVPGMEPDVLRLKMPNGGFVTLRKPKDTAVSKETFAEKLMPKIIEQVSDADAAKKYLEDMWRVYSEFSVAPQTNAVPANAAPVTEWNFQNGQMIKVR